jgi:hypothetical protein
VPSDPTVTVSVITAVRPGCGWIVSEPVEPGENPLPPT